MTHCIDVCLCGAVQYNCPCPGMKPERVVQHTCAACVRDEPRALLGGVKFAASTFQPTEMCVSEEDAESNRAVRLACFQVIGDLRTLPADMLNPQALLARVYEHYDVPEVWAQLARDLISEALGEERLRRRETESLVGVYDAAIHEDAVDAVLAERGYTQDPGDKIVSNLVAIVMKRTQGRADPAAVKTYLRSKLAS